ncbi:MAG: putative addiction module antidote protein [Proteobacteria bacterium]|nr:putative addiction module antidote protein [Pseudomonadota bacterium]
MAMKTAKSDVQNPLKTRTERIAYLAAVLEDGDPGLIAAALGDIARAVGPSKFARETGLSRETIYKALKPGGNPTLDTVSKSVKALGLRLSLAAR